LIDVQNVDPAPGIGAAYDGKQRILKRRRDVCVLICFYSGNIFRKRNVYLKNHSESISRFFEGKSMLHVVR